MVKICITGDISFANIQEHKIGLYLKSIFENSNLFVGNLEAVFTNYDRRRKLHPYHLKADKSLLNTIKIFDSFSLANNHILDYGKKGFEDTVAVMKENGKYFFGAGISKKEAEKPFTNEINGIKIAIWGVSRFANSRFYRKIGTASDRSKRLLKEITKYKKEGFFNIVMPHWSYEYVPYPSPLDRTVARRLVGAGADVIVGSHPHVAQGIEELNGKTIFYSLGNFIFSSKDFADKSNWKLFKSFAVELSIAKDLTYSYRLIPYVTSDEQVEAANESDSKQILEYVESISRNFSLPKEEYKILFYESIRSMRVHRARLHVPVKSSKAKRSFLKKLRGVLIKIKYMNWQDFKLAYYLYFSSRFSKK